MNTKRVVITGLGAITPLGNNVDEYFSNLVAGISGAAPITRFDAEKFKTQFACEVKGFDPLDHFDRKETRKLDRYSQFTLVAAKEAIENAGLDVNAIDPYRAGVIWASANGGMETFQDQVIEFSENGRNPKFNPFLIPKMLVDSAAGLISIKYGFKGVNYAPVSACASSTSAVIQAFNNIRWGKADLIFTGGAEAPITYAGIGGFGALKALSTRNDDPQSASRPFDVDRDGFVAAEGAGALVVESLEHAQARNANILAEIVGAGETADAYHITSTHPEGEGALRSMNECLREAGISANQLDYVNAHATSTGAGDISESNAIRGLGDDISLHVSATKSMTGHLLGAAGAVEAISAILSIQKDIIPPTINTKTLDDRLAQGLNIVTEKALKKEINYALSNTFGFGGHNASVLMKKFES